MNQKAEMYREAFSNRWIPSLPDSLTDMKQFNVFLRNRIT